MTAEISRNNLLLLFIFLMPLHCATGSKNNGVWQGEPEGYVFLDIRLFDEADELGFARLNKPSSDSVFLPVSRKMYIRRHYLIDVIQNVHTNNGRYIKTDTSGYEFYDLQTQRFAGFNGLSTGAGLRTKGTISGNGGSFSNAPESDPMNGLPDSLWQVTDTVVNGDTTSVVSFKAPTGSEAENMGLFSKTKFWVNNKVKNFPLQLSYLLSKKLNNAFVYKMQLPSPDGNSMLITTLDYQHAPLPEDIIAIFKRWSELVNR